MYEVELKLRADHAKVRKRLEELGADPDETVTQVDTYYNAPDRDFAVTDEALRLRRERDASGSTERVLVTYKGPLVDDSSKTRNEAETRVTDETAMEAILRGLGYEPAATVTKRRVRHTVGECIVTLDHVDGLGEFVEIEYHEGVSSADVPTARQTVKTCLTKLALDPEETIQTSYLELVLAAE